MSVLQDLESDRSLACDHLVIVVRGNEGRAGFAFHLARRALSIVVTRATFNEGDRISSYSFNLCSRSRFRHDNGRLKAQHFATMSNRESVIARRNGQHTTHSFGWSERREFRHSAAKLE